MAFFLTKAAQNEVPNHFDAANQVSTEATMRLYNAASSGDLRGIELAVKEGANVNFMVRAADGATSLHAACRAKNSTACVNLLVGVGAFVEAKLLGNYNTPLHEAITSGNDESARILVQKGDAIMAKNAFGNTPMFQAIKIGNLEMAMYLMEKGNHIDTMNNRGSSFLNLCAALCVENEVVVAAPNENTPPPKAAGE